ncbi:MAG: HD domain-containing phosphohydrolase [Pseudomonadota bacterium]
MTEGKAQILFVDDERPILNALKRLLRPTGHRVHVASSGEDGLAILNENAIDVVVSDMRMPGMDGAEFLAKVAQQKPDTTRILLTGYAELTSAIDAINNGAILRYLTKPWQDEDLVMCLQQVIEVRRLAQEKERLEVVNAKQNEELRQLNEALEARVAKRTQQIHKAREEIVASHNELQASYSATIEVLSRVVQKRTRTGNRSSVAHDARAVGAEMGLNEDECKSLYQAGLLCDFGKLSLPDTLLNTPYTRLDADAQREYHEHPVVAETTLVSLEPLASAASIVRMHCERDDGSGFPDKIAGDQIPLAARILAVCKSFADLQEGRLLKEKLTAIDAQAYIVNEKGKRYDAAVVDVFIAWLGDARRTTREVAEKKVSVAGLRAGMKTTRDLCDENGMLILASGQLVSSSLLSRLDKLQRRLKTPLTIYVAQQ